MSNVWVCGAKGQLGLSLQDIAGRGSKHKYFFTDVDEVDICSRDSVEDFVRQNKINVIINCAAYTAVDAAEEDKEKAYEVNHTAVKYLSQSAKDSRCFLFHISTDYVFDGKGEKPYREDDMTRPVSVYGDSKWRGERAIVESGCKYIILRTAWLYSQYGKNFVKTMIRLTSEKETIKVVNDQVGCPTYAGDLARVIYDIVEENKYEGSEGVYHYVGGGDCSWYEFAQEVAHMAGNDRCEIQPCTTSEYPTAAHRPQYSVLSTGKIEKAFDIEIPYWKDSLGRCIEKIQNENR
ncbi:MAG: dTDP-4-dehydrorhamnose reductase [Flavobacteriales bacterium]|nr:dTDP-4-dehydrorhamnose reductase [Flavobacteriales bacterium]